jgi:hypothetical protein
MDKEKVKVLNALVRERGEQIQKLLPTHQSHPGGRIGIAHLYWVIKDVMGVPMKECRDSRYDDIVEIIQYCVDNAKDEDIMDALYDKYEPEPVYKPVTLDNFFD